MALPPLYKYLDVDGAQKTLGNNCFKHAKPSTFNDTEDLTVAGIFPGSLEAAVAEVEANFVDVIVANLHIPSTAKNLSMRAKVATLQQLFRANPAAVDLMKEAMKKTPGLLALNEDRIRAVAEQTISDVNAFMQGYRVLCVTTHKDSEKMWSGYAENHQGIALRIEANIDKDSKYQLFRPVAYREKRPTLYRDAAHYIASSLFDDQEASALAIMNEIVYTKTLKWQDESEYRLAIPIGQGEADWGLLKFHPEEITEIYLGIDISSKADVIAKARALNPTIAVFQMNRGADGKLVAGPSA